LSWVGKARHLAADGVQIALAAGAHWRGGGGLGIHHAGDGGLDLRKVAVFREETDGAEGALPAGGGAFGRGDDEDRHIGLGVQQRNARIAHRARHLQIQHDQRQIGPRQRRGRRRPAFRPPRCGRWAAPPHGQRKRLPEQRMIVGDEHGLGQRRVLMASCGGAAGRCDNKEPGRPA
jgi:hypothetical protein